MAPRLETGEASVPLLGQEEGLLGVALRFPVRRPGVRTAPPWVLRPCPFLSRLSSLRKDFGKLSKPQDLSVLTQTQQAQVTAFKNQWAWGRRAS